MQNLPVLCFLNYLHLYILTSLGLTNVKIINKFSVSLLLLIIASCNNTPKPPYFAPDNAAQLIAGDSVKTWKLAKRFNDGHRMNMGACFLSYRVSYFTNGTSRDNNDQNLDCGESLAATWELFSNQDGSFIKLTSDQMPLLLNQEDNYKYFRINSVSDSILVLQYRHKQYANYSTLIVDYLVPENQGVKDRDFHNK